LRFFGILGAHQRSRGRAFYPEPVHHEAGHTIQEQSPYNPRIFPLVTTMQRFAAIWSEDYTRGRKFLQQLLPFVRLQRLFEQVLVGNVVNSFTSGNIKQDKLIIPAVIFVSAFGRSNGMRGQLKRT
jgi:hypothetical protein